MRVASKRFVLVCHVLSIGIGTVFSTFQTMKIVNMGKKNGTMAIVSLLGIAFSTMVILASIDSHRSSDI